MQLLLDCFNDEWDLPKFHFMLHFPYFITQFGPPKNYDAQRRENSHIEFAKNPGRRSQKTHFNQSFEQQVAQRCSDSIIINQLHDKVIGQKSLNTFNDSSICLNETN